MMTISSPAGRRLAKAHAEYHKASASLRDLLGSSIANYPELTARKHRQDAARIALNRAAQEVGAELCEQGFHDMDGED